MGDFLAVIFRHHWLGKSSLTIVMIGLVVVVAPTRRFDERRWANCVFGSVIVGSLSSSSISSSTTSRRKEGT